MAIIIYILRCIPNGKVYIGQTARTLRARWRQHLSNASRSPKFLIYRAIRKYTGSQFSLEQICIASSQKEANILEKYYIQFYNSTDSSRGYNTHEGGAITPHHPSPEERKHMSALKKEWYSNPENRRKISIATKNAMQDPGVRLRISNGNRGRKHTESAREAMSRSRLGHETSQETRRKISMACKGQKRSTEVKQKMSSDRKGIGTGRTLPIAQKKRISDSIAAWWIKRKTLG